ncbi:MAG: hypothetical protein KBT29_01655 [Prevotellaceae bacterium]|nr:hypothetical protein [Candidatus Minthosoma caballi]
MDQTLLVGNGISKLLNQEKLDWKAVLKSTLKADQQLLGEIASGSSIIPYTHLYEDIMLNEKFGHHPNTDKIDLTELKKHIKSYLEDVLSQPISSGFNNVANQLLEINWNNILTTNYEYTLARVLTEKNYIYKKTRQQSVYSTRRKHHYENTNGKELDLWYIHGELDYVKSIMLGYDHYCGSLSKVSDYIKNGKLSDNLNDDSTVSLKEDKGIHHILKKLFLYGNHDTVEYSTWMDTFFFSDVHIIGLGLDFQEIDLWWMLNKRHRYIKTMYALAPKYRDLRINNQIFYYGKTSKEIKAVLEAYGVDTTNTDDSSSKIDNWSVFYSENIAKIKENINNRKQM